MLLRADARFGQGDGRYGWPLASSFRPSSVDVLRGCEPVTGTGSGSPSNGIALFTPCDVPLAARRFRAARIATVVFKDALANRRSPYRLGRVRDLGCRRDELACYRSQRERREAASIGSERYVQSVQAPRPSKSS